MPRGFQYAADVSSNNGPISVPAYSRAGHAALIVKATQGISYVNPYHFRQTHDAHDYGLTVVHYHFVNGADAQQQINHFRNIYIRSWRDGDYVCLDMEVSAFGVHFASDMLAKLAAQTGHPPILYTYRSFLENQLRGVVVPGKRLWLADYSNNPSRYDKSLYRLWARQYTDGSEGPEPHYYTGIGNCDGSIISYGPALAIYLRKIRNIRRKR